MQTPFRRFACGQSLASEGIFRAIAPPKLGIRGLVHNCPLLSITGRPISSTHATTPTIATIATIAIDCAAPAALRAEREEEFHGDRAT